MHELDSRSRAIFCAQRAEQGENDLIRSSDPDDCTGEELNASHSAARPGPVNPEYTAGGALVL